MVRRPYLGAGARTLEPLPAGAVTGWAVGGGVSKLVTVLERSQCTRFCGVFAFLGAQSRAVKASLGKAIQTFPFCHVSSSLVGVGRSSVLGVSGSQSL